jgi:hypothetical protein
MLMFHKILIASHVLACKARLLHFNTETAFACGMLNRSRVLREDKYMNSWAPTA